MLKKKFPTNLVFSKLSVQPGNLLFYALSSRVDIRHTVTNVNRIRLLYAYQDPGSSAFESWINPGSVISVSDPYSFFPDPEPDPDPEVEAGCQYGSGSNPDPGL